MSGPHQPVQRALDIGEERITAQPGAQPDPTGLDRPGHAVETDRERMGEQFTDRPGLPRLTARRVPGRRGLHPVFVLGERERERNVGSRVAVSVDIDPMDRIRVKLRAGDGRRYRRRGARRVRVDDYHRVVRVGCRLEHEQIREVQAPVVAGKLEIVSAEMIRHDESPQVVIVCAGLLVLRRS